MKLTENFDLSEFAVSGSHPELVIAVPTKYIANVKRLAETCLQPARDKWGKPLRILSGFRSRALNAAVGGSPTSQHCIGEAADVTTDDVRGLFLMLMAEENDILAGQIIAYPSKNFVHIAVPSGRYPSPSFFVSLRDKTYTRVSSVSALNSLAPAPW